jgi:hypothetical protein
MSGLKQATLVIGSNPITAGIRPIAVFLPMQGCPI